MPSGSARKRRFRCCEPTTASTGWAERPAWRRCFAPWVPRCGLIGGVGNDPDAAVVRRMLTEQGIDDQLVLPLDDRPTTLKERYIGRAQDRHPQQMIRVDYETRDPIPAVVEARLHSELPDALEWADVVLISDYDKGVCTPTLAPRGHRSRAAAGVKVLVDPIRSTDYSRYRGVHCMTPNRLEAQLATGLTIARRARRAPSGEAVGRDAWAWRPSW